MSDEKSKSEVIRDPSDPLGFLIIPVFGVILVAVLLLWFNQKKDVDEQKFFPVSGKITMNNKPLEGYFQVNFHPADDSYTPIASAIIEEDGTYELWSGTKGIKGAMPGEYRVSVKMLEKNDESFRMQGTDPKEIKINPKDGGTVVPPDPDPPYEKTFADPRKTPQRAIVGKTDNRIDIDLPRPRKVSSKKKSSSKKSGKSNALKSKDGNSSETAKKKPSLKGPQNSKSENSKSKNPQTGNSESSKKVDTKGKSLNPPAKTAN